MEMNKARVKFPRLTCQHSGLRKGCQAMAQRNKLPSTRFEYRSQPFDSVPHGEVSMLERLPQELLVLTKLISPFPAWRERSVDLQADVLGSAKGAQEIVRAQGGKEHRVRFFSATPQQ